MRGEFIEVWSETWREIWSKLPSQKNAPSDLFCELYNELILAFKKRPPVEEIAEIINDPEKSEEIFVKTKYEDFSSEWALIRFLESTNEVLDDLGGGPLSNYYFNLLEAFIEKFNLRYDLRKPCMLCPTLPGLFTSLLCDLRDATSQDVYLNNHMKDFENSIRDLRIDCSDTRIKTCIQKQVNLLEAMGRRYPGVKEKTIGKICDQLKTWPHETVKEAMKSLYKFTCDYPGIRHSGTIEGATRDIEMKDMVAVSILLIGFVPYLTNKLDAEILYRGR
ncbi:hypothetical protein [Methanosarcina mazei]|uniref:Uncharacterized protein n=1 Tax=Methanosarcina mazei TaxID=2209 RepID=A0A6C0VIA9_METMZ|nr:hypothetical protein [Methanosarcina mazei]QIB91199.1 hypothetical protein FQU78_09235 [Methanosarcina mazei]